VEWREAIHLMASLPFSLSDCTDFEIDDIIHLEQYKAAKVTQKL